MHTVIIALGSRGDVQPYVALGKGLQEPVPRKALTVERLAQAIGHAVTDREMRQRAARLGRKIREENGVARAVEVVGAIESKEGVV